MRCSKTRAWTAFVPAAVLAVTLAGPAAAQAPDQPAPANGAPAATGAPRALPGIVSHSLPPPTAAAPTSTNSPQSGVTVSTLAAPEGPPAGTLDSAHGGLGADLWQGSSRSDVEELMARLPIATPVPPVRALARRLILTTAPPPLGPAKIAFTTLRIRRLLDAGLLNDAADLAEVAQVPNNPGFAHVQAEAFLYAQRPKDICSDKTATRLNSSQPFWIEMRAYCYAVAGDSAALALTRQVMDARNIDDEAFDTLLGDVRSDVSKNPGNIDDPTALHAYLLHEADQPVSFDVGAQLGTPGLLLAVRSKQNSPDDRLRAAEQLLPTGALTAQDLIAVADAQSFSRHQFETERAQLEKMPFLEGQALLRQAVVQASAGAKPALIYQALSRADMAGQFHIAAVLQAGELLKLEPQPALRSMAALMARALLLTGHVDAAEQWVSVLNPVYAPDRENLAFFETTLNLMASNPLRQAAAQTAMSQLSQDIAGGMPDQGRAALVLGLYEDLGLALPPATQAEADAIAHIEWPGRRPAPSTLKRLAAAMAASGRRGEALMLVLNAIGSKGPGDLAPDVTVDLVRDLVREGVPRAARGIAIAALLRYRPSSESPPINPAAATAGSARSP